ncbi:TPA: hypothetical protein IF960_001849 [Escherichia coli]|nr:hypothetical protein [Escherichia coli]
MTVSTEVDHNEYTGNGATTSFPYTFRIFKKSDLVVQVSDLNGNVTELVLDTDYTVTNAGGYNGGNVILSKALANGYHISISRELPVTQETDLRNQGKFFAEVHEDAFDKLTMLIQKCFSWMRLALIKPSILANYYDAKNNKISNLANATDRNDAVNKGYVDDLFTGGVTPTPNSAKNDIFTNHQRKIVATMPLLFPEYDAIMAANPSATYMYPQGFCVSEDLIYITYPFEPKQTNNVVAVFNISGIYQGYFYVQAGGPGFAAEGIVVTSDYGPKKMFVGHTNGILREFNMEGALYGSNLPLVQNHDVGLFNQFSYRRGIWLVEQNAPEVGQKITRTVLAVFDSGFNRLSTITLPLHDVGYVTKSTSPYAPYFNKRQGIAVGDNYFVCGYGGFIADGAGSAGYSEYQGSKVFNPDGTKRTESMLHPQAMMDLMKAAGLNVTRIENEGVCVSQDGKSIYSLYIHQERTGSEPYNSGLVIFEDFSTDKDAIDFTPASRLYRGFDIDHASIGVYPRSAKGIVNPVDGTLFTNMTEILRYMQEMSQKAFNFYTGTVSIADISGVAIPSSTYVEILNANNQTFIVNYYSSDSGISYLVATNPSGDFVFVRQRPAQWASNLTIQQNADPDTNQLNRITASSYAGATTNSQKILVLDQQATASANSLVLGGSSSVFRSATTVDIACNSDPTALGGTIRWRFYDTGLRPFADNTYNFGQASFRIKDAYFANAPTVSSDATLKTNPEAISDLSEMLSSDRDSILDAWGDISVVAYRWLDAISMKGDGARWHFGVMAQQVRDVFQAHGIDGTRFGLLCYDEWDDIFEPVIATKEITDASGELVTVEYDTGEQRLVKKAGSSWGIRPDQCAWLEAAYQRRRCDRIEERLELLESK